MQELSQFQKDVLYQLREDVRLMETKNDVQ